MKLSTFLGAACVAILLAIGFSYRIQTYAQTQRINMSWGYVDFSGNEMTIRSTVADPPKVRLEATAGSSMGGITFAMVRPDGRAEEVAIIQGKPDERRRGCREDYSGELTFHVRDGNAPGDGMKLVMRMRHDSVWLAGISPPIETDMRPCER